MNGFFLKLKPQTGCAILATALSIYTIKSVGLTFDEKIYIDAGMKYLEWLSSPSLSALDSFWTLNHEHPPFAKLLIGFGVWFFHSLTGFTDVLTAARIPNLAWVFMAYFFFFKLATEWKGYRVAWLSGFFFFTLPRVTFHSTLAALDYASVSISIVLAYFAIRLVNESKDVASQKWLSISKTEIWFSLFLGLGLLTRLSTILMLIPISVLFAVHYSHIESGRIRFLVRSMVAPLVLAFSLFVVCWPWLWQHPILRLREYFAFQLNHFTIPTTYFNERTFSAPWHFPFVMTFITTPEFSMILMIIGLYLVSKRIVKARWTGPDHRSDASILRDIFLLACCIIPLILAAYNAPKYDGVRLFLPVFPFLSLMAGYAFDKLWNPFDKNYYLKLVLLSCLLWVTATFVRIQPYGASYYNAFIGGMRGAERNGFELDFWCSPMKRFIPFLERNSDKKFWLAPCKDTVKGYQALGLLKPDVQLEADEDSGDLLLLDLRQGFLSNRQMYYYQNVVPLESLKIDGITVAGIYPIEHPVWGIRKISGNEISGASGIVGYVTFVQKNAADRESPLTGIDISIYSESKSSSPIRIITSDSLGMYKSLLTPDTYKVCASNFQSKRSTTSSPHFSNDLCTNVKVSNGSLSQVNFVFSETAVPTFVCLSGQCH